MLKLVPPACPIAPVNLEISMGSTIQEWPCPIHHAERPAGISCERRAQLVLCEYRDSLSFFICKAHLTRTMSVAIFDQVIGHAPIMERTEMLYTHLTMVAWGQVRHDNRMPVDDPSE